MEPVKNKIELLLREFIYNKKLRRALPSMYDDLCYIYQKFRFDNYNYKEELKQIDEAIKKYKSMEAFYAIRG